MDAQHLKRAALTYARAGLSVFTLSLDRVPWPNCSTCWDTCTTPLARELCGHPFCHGFYAATIDPIKLMGMLKTRPQCALAIRTGVVSDLVVIDVDTKEGAKGKETLTLWASTYPDLLRTRWCRTASGGWHLWMSHPGGQLKCSIGKMGPGLDVRSDGGYVVVPPTTLEDGRSYSWPAVEDQFSMLRMSTELRDGIQSLSPKPRTVRESVADGGTAGQLIATVRRADQGERNSLLFWAACRAAEGAAQGKYDAADIAQDLVDAAVQAGVPAGEAWRTVRSGMGRSVVD